MTEDELDALRNIFVNLDTNGDGELSPEEIMQGYRMISHDSVDITSIMFQVNASGSGNISFNEFLTATAEKE